MGTSIGPSPAPCIHFKHVHFTKKHANGSNLVFHYDGCTNREGHFAWMTKYCMVVPKICVSSLWNLLYVTLLVPRGPG